MTDNLTINECYTLDSKIEAHHWIIEGAEKGKAWLDAQCKKCFQERKYKSTMLTKYQPDQTKIKIESLDSIIDEETRRADKEDEPQW